MVCSLTASLLSHTTSLSHAPRAQVDTPGHAAILALARPSVLTYCPTAGHYGRDYYTIDPTRDSTYSFLSGVLSELVGANGVFPDAQVAVGGDEVDTTCWSVNKTVLSWLAARGMPLSQLQAYYEGRLISMLRGGGGTLGPPKSVIAWQEVFNRAADPVATLGRDGIVDVWLTGSEQRVAGSRRSRRDLPSSSQRLAATDDPPFDRETVAKVTAAGLGAIISACWYLDSEHKETVRIHGLNPTPSGLAVRSMPLSLACHLPGDRAIKPCHRRREGASGSITTTATHRISTAARPSMSASLGGMAACGVRRQMHRICCPRYGRASLPSLSASGRRARARPTSPSLGRGYTSSAAFCSRGASVLDRLAPRRTRAYRLR